MSSIARSLGLLVLAILSLGCPVGAVDYVYYGTYTGGKSKGIYVSRFDPSNGALSKPELAAEAVNPSFLALRPGGRFLYAVGEVNSSEGQPGGAVLSFAIDRATGALHRLNQQSSGGAGPCHIAVDATGRWALVANYGGGSVAVLPIRKDGSLGEAVSFIQHHGSSVNPRRQKEPHAHSVNLAPSNRFALVADLGLDKILVYRFDPETGALTSNSPPAAMVAPGSGPRHFVFHRDRRHAFGINEILSTVTIYGYDPRAGVLDTRGTVSTLPAGFTGDNTTAEIRCHPTGPFVYGSNRGADSIAVFRWNPKEESLTVVQNESTQGRTPRNFEIDPSGRWLLAANQDSDSVVTFAIDPKSGELTPTGGRVEVGAPVCLQFLRVR